MADSDFLHIDLYCAFAAVVSSEFLTSEVTFEVFDFRKTLMLKKNATVGDQELVQ